MPMECTRSIKLPVEDPDGDKVRCRWSTVAECGHACTNTPVNTVWLDEVSGLAWTKCTVIRYSHCRFAHECLLTYIYLTV